jgi:prepilin-type N-terminal cleavage/methylation domain-containing protein
MIRRAFTLIELLVVIAIIGILSGAIYPVLMSINEHSRLTVCRSRLTELGLALRLYMSDWDASPADLRDLYELGYVTDDDVLQCAVAHKPFTYERPHSETAREAVIAGCPGHVHGKGRSRAELHLNGKVTVHRVTEWD